MAPSEAQIDALQQALGHLYDPAYHPSEALSGIVPGRSSPGREEIQAALFLAVRELEPPPSAPANARSRQIHEVLSLRYVHKLTQEETAERLSITPRHLRRRQRDAVHVLAARLFGPLEPREGPFATESDPLLPEDGQRSDWQSQVRREVASLRKGAATQSADVRGVLRGVVELTRVVGARHDVELVLEDPGDELLAEVHPSSLRQALVAAVTDLIGQMSGGSIAICAMEGEGRIDIAIQTAPIRPEDVECSFLVQEILGAEGGTCHVEAGTGGATLRLSLPAQERIGVLVVDDNPDLVHFYRRYTTGTRYHIDYIHTGRQIFQAIEKTSPQVIVLDVMLPDMDGWELLTQLHAHAETRDLPVIVCSVVREEELALALGAAALVPKPVRRQGFLAALDQALVGTE